MRGVRVRYRRAAFAVAALALCGCELTEITLAAPEDVIVAEVVLVAGEDVQRAYLHRTGGTSDPARVNSARVTVQDEDTGRGLQYVVSTEPRCLEGRDGQGASAGTCYIASNARDFVRPEGRYSLRIEVEDRVMTGRLQAPGVFQLLRPTPMPQCRLSPRQSLELVWTRAADAWVYAMDARFTGLQEALRRDGVDVTGTAPVELTGLAISGADTTLIFPRELGLFDRFDPDLHPILLAIQDGLPAGVHVELAIGAGDRNYVNWVRGGTFNPSGQVRVPSVQGEGTGVFGAIVAVHQYMYVGDANLPPCV